MKIEDALDRLAFIKYLYGVGVDQSRKVEPFCRLSVLTFHDAVELFLELSAEYLDIPKKVTELQFAQYYALLNPALKKKGKNELTRKIAIDKLNKARIAFKHHGTSPSKSDIDDFRADIAEFFEESTSNIFGVNFSEISLIELVKCQNAKSTLKESQQMLSENKLDEALDKVAIAFEQLIDDYEVRKTDEWGRSPFFFGRRMDFLSSFFMDIPRGNKLADFIDRVKESIEAIQESVKILSLGLDYRRYAKFRLLTPIVQRTQGSGGINYVAQRVSNVNPTKEAVHFCINFVVESAVTLQEFDFDIEKRERSMATLKDAF